MCGGGCSCGESFDPSADAEWSEQNPLDELVQRVDEFVLSHQDDTGEEERWRSKLNKRIGRLETNLEVRIADVQAVLKQLQATLQQALPAGGAAVGASARAPPAGAPAGAPSRRC